MMARGGWIGVLPVLLLAIAIGGAPSTAAAAAASGAADYRDRVFSARESLEGYLETGGEASPGPLVPALLRELPVSERVVVGQTEVLADHSTFRTLLMRLDVSRDPQARAEIAGEMVEHLRAIERSLPGDDDPVPADADVLQELLDESNLSARSPLSELLGEFIDRVAAAFERWQTALASSSAPRRIMAIGLGVVIAGLAATLLWVLVRFAVRLRASTSVSGRTPAASHGGVAVVAAAEALPADALAYAESLAAAGRFAEAVRALFGGAARSLAEAGLLTRTRTRTNAELLFDVAARAPSLARPLAALSGRFELAVYGHRDPGVEGYARARSDYDAVLAQIGSVGGESA